MALQQAGDVADDSLDGDAVLLKQLARVKAVVEVVIDAVAANAHVTVAQASGNLFTPSAGEDAVFQRDNNAVPIGQGRNELLVKFRGEARVDECGLDPMLSKGSYDPFAKLEEIETGLVPGTRITTGSSRWPSDQSSISRYSSTQVGANTRRLGKLPSMARSK